jgi:hypothetical protein
MSSLQAPCQLTASAVFHSFFIFSLSTLLSCPAAEGNVSRAHDRVNAVAVRRAPVTPLGPSGQHRMKAVWVGSRNAELFVRKLMVALTVFRHSSHRQRRQYAQTLVVLQKRERDDVSPHGFSG